MLKSRIFNIISIIVIVLWILADRYLKMDSSAYGWLLLIYVSVIFCGSYFISINFFVNSVNRGNVNGKSVALTFDDGPSDKQTSRVLDILKTNKVEAAFFCIGNRMKENETILKRTLAEGHMIGNHSFSHHRFFDLFSPGKMLMDLRRMSSLCQQLTGSYPIMFRPPFGVTNPNLKKAILQGGFISVGWTIRSFDTILKNEDRLLKRISRKIKPGAIILLHDTSEITIQVLPRLIEIIRGRGFQIQRLDQMVNMNPYA
jgi:peptidoglycan-N-acetylglucosamine deacetylase